MNKIILPVGEYNTYYANYINLFKYSELSCGLVESLNETLSFYESIPEGKFNFRYTVGKWNVKEIIQHLLDTERVFAYRALCFSRKESIALPDFDQNNYLMNANASSRYKSDLIKEYKTIRNATITLFESFTDQMLKQIGIASGSKMSVRAAGYIIIGHEAHHCNIIRERYL